MTRVVIDASTTARLKAIRTAVELTDESGQVLGQFVPASALEPRVSDEELDRREAEGGGRSLEAILADLEKRP